MTRSVRSGENDSTIWRWLALIAPRHQAFDDGDACEVVVDDGDHQHQQNGKSREEHFFLHADAEVAAREAFEAHDENMAAVEDWNRQQVEEAKVEADRRHQREERYPALLRRLARQLRNRERPHELACRGLPRNQLTDRPENEAGRFVIALEAERERIDRAWLDARDIFADGDADATGARRKRWTASRVGLGDQRQL